MRWRKRPCRMERDSPPGFRAHLYTVPVCALCETVRCACGAMEASLHTSKEYAMRLARKQHRRP